VQDDDEDMFQNLLELFDESLEDKPYEEDFVTANILGQNQLLMDYIVPVSSFENIDYMKLNKKYMYDFLQKMKDHYQTFFNAVHKYVSQTDNLHNLEDECAVVSFVNYLKIRKNLPSSFSEEEKLLLNSYNMWLETFSNCQIKYFKVP